MIERINGIVWGNWLLMLMLFCGMYLTCKIGFIQFKLRDILRGTVLSKSANKCGKDTISPFQTMTTSLSATMGTGNIVGVASAIMIGGAGAVFWLWVSAVFGMALIYVENYLGVRYRTTLKDGSTVGGACAYLEYGLHSKALATVFAMLCIGASFGMGNMAQANSIATSLYSTWNVPTWLSGTVTALLIAMVIIGGVKRIGSITQYLIPVLSTGYIVGALLVIFSSADRLPQVFRSIFLQAFGVDSVTGGVTGGLLTAINVGFRRGVFSNEVGLGSSSMLHSSAESQNAHTMGLWGMFEVFVDTMVCCTLTALAILVTDIPHALDSTNLVIESFKHGLGEYSVVFITVAIALFAFATLVGWSVCGETCSKYLFGASGVTVYRVFFVGCIVLGSVLNGGAVWTISDIFNGLMAIPNLIGIMLLSVKLDFKKAIGNAHDMSIPKE